MSNDYYLKVFKQNLLIEEAKLENLKKELEQVEKQYGIKHFRYEIALRRVSISSEYISGKKYFLEHGVPRNPIQSISLPPDILEKL
jgi:hypothetical protein